MDGPGSPERTELAHEDCALPASVPTGRTADLLEAYERLIYDAMSGDHTRFSSAEGIESLWERSQPLLDHPPPVRPYPPGSWGPNAIHQLIAPDAWCLPFERARRTTSRAGFDSA